MVMQSVGITDGERRLSNANSAPKSVSPDTITRPSCAAKHQKCVVLRSLQTELQGVHRIVPSIAEQTCQPRRTVLVDEELHAVGCNGISRSATASAAKRNAAATSSISNGGSSSTIC